MLWTIHPARKNVKLVVLFQSYAHKLVVHKLLDSHESQQKKMKRNMYLRYAPTLGFIQSAVHDPTVKISCLSFRCQHAPHLPLVELYIPIDIRNQVLAFSKKERHESGDLIRRDGDKLCR